jgi:hypothetical protein
LLPRKNAGRGEKAADAMSMRKFRGMRNRRVREERHSGATRSGEPGIHTPDCDYRFLVISDVRFTPKDRHRQPAQSGPKCASSGLMRRSKQIVILKQFRRVATRFEKTARNYPAIVTLAAIISTT